jgi:multidrug resistance efflux pump
VREARFRHERGDADANRARDGDAIVAPVSGPREGAPREGAPSSGGDEVAPANRRFSFRSHRAVLSAAVAIVVAVGGGALILAPPATEKTDDAYVGADVTTVAPRIRGFVADVLVRDNQRVHAGEPLVRSRRYEALVKTGAVSVRDAETLRTRAIAAEQEAARSAALHPGQVVTIRADALPGHDFCGVVESLAPGSGSQFALLPFEPGTGNFTKIVQRVAVRIRFAGDQTELDVLRPGLSVTAKVRVKS